MAIYDLKIFHPDDVTLVQDVPLSFGRLDPGITSSILKIHIWNDPGGLVGADIAPTPRLYALSLPDNVDALWTGTPLNGMVSMLEARSCAAVGVAADQQQTWTPIGPNQILVMGNIPANSLREIELRLRVPVDAAEMTPQKSWQIRVTA